MREFRIGTRESRLAMWQAQWVAGRLREICPGISVSLVAIKTKGDNILDAALAKIGDKGLFTRELETALLNNEVDMAVHSMKDLPTVLPHGMALAAICQREYPGDVLISKGGGISELPRGSVIGTSSLRRIAQLKRFRPDLQMVNVRGNLITRLRKLDTESMDALILAYAGMVRLGFKERITELVPFEVSLPAVGQGSVGVEAREDDRELLKLLKILDHGPSRIAVTTERALMRRLEGGCQIPVGALAIHDGDEIVLEAMVADLDGKMMIRSSMSGPSVDPEGLGIRLAEAMLAEGAGEILKKVRQEFDVDVR